MWESWVASLKKYSNKTDYLFFILCIAGIVLLAWTLKNCIKAGDEVIAGISAALITLLGVNLTNKNSQIALDKQLNHQSETFQTQLKDQAEGFKDQIKHQNELLERQLKHQSDENDIDRKQKFKHDQYIELIKCLSGTQSHFAKNIFLKFDEYESMNKLSILKENINLVKITSSTSISKKLDEIYGNYQKLLITFTNESTVLRALQLEEKRNYKLLGWIDERVEVLSMQFLENVNVGNDLETLAKYKAEHIKQIEDTNSKKSQEMIRLMDLFKSQVSEINLTTSVIVQLVNIELGYISLEDFIDGK